MEKIIRKLELLSKPFLTNEEAIELLEVKRNTYFTYKKEIRNIDNRWVPGSIVNLENLLKVAGIDKATFRADLERTLEVLKK